MPHDALAYYETSVAPIIHHVAMLLGVNLSERDDWQIDLCLI